jgi:hypothetical protein
MVCGVDFFKPVPGDDDEAEEDHKKQFPETDATSFGIMSSLLGVKFGP